MCGNIKRSVCWENMWTKTFPELRLCQSVWENQRLKRKGRFSRTLLGHGRIVCTNNFGQISKKTGDQMKKTYLQAASFCCFPVCTKRCWWSRFPTLTLYILILKCRTKCFKKCILFMKKVPFLWNGIGKNVENRKVF